MTPAMPKHAGRSGRTWRRLRTTIAAIGDPCHICGQPIDYSIPYFDRTTGKVNPESFTVDHRASLAHHAELAEDPANLRPTHARCNLYKGEGSDLLPLGQLSEEW